MSRATAKRSVVGDLRGGDAEIAAFEEAEVHSASHHLIHDHRALAAVAVGVAGLVCGVIAASLAHPALAIFSAVGALAAAVFAVWLAGDATAAERRAADLTAQLSAANTKIGKLQKSLDSDERTTLGTHSSARQGGNDEGDRLTIIGASQHPAAADAARLLEGPPPDLDLTAEAGPLVTGVLRDTETGLLNEGYFRANLEERFAAARRHLRPVTVVMMDVSVEGATLADEPEPTTVASVLRQTFREADSVCRLIDGRYAAVLEDTPDTSALWALERTRRALQLVGPIALRAGIAAYPTHGLGPDEVLNLAEVALNQACRRGHDGIQVAASD